MNFNLTKNVYLSFSRVKLVFPGKYREKGLFPSFPGRCGKNRFWTSKTEPCVSQSCFHPSIPHKFDFSTNYVKTIDIEHILGICK